MPMSAVRIHFRWSAAFGAAFVFVRFFVFVLGVFFIAKFPFFGMAMEPWALDERRSARTPRRREPVSRRDAKSDFGAEPIRTGCPQGDSTNGNRRPKLRTRRRDLWTRNGAMEPLDLNCF